MASTYKTVSGENAERQTKKQEKSETKKKIEMQNNIVFRCSQMFHTFRSISDELRIVFDISPLEPSIDHRFGGTNTTGDDFSAGVRFTLLQKLDASTRNTTDCPHMDVILYK